MTTMNAGSKCVRGISEARLYYVVVLLTIAAVSLSAPLASAQYIYVANAGEDTLSKININTKTEEARYRTWFGPAGKTGYINHATPTSTNAWTGPAPSRIAVDAAGNIYVLNRFFPPPNHLPVLIKILPSGGTNTSTGPIALDMEDSDPDGPGPQLPNGQIDPWEIQDDRIAWARPIGVAPQDLGQLGRSLCLDTQGNAWVGLFKNGRYYKVSPNGTMDPTPVETNPTGSATGHKPYGCVVTNDGILWSASSTDTVAEINTDPTKKTVKVWTHANRINYSVSLINGCDKKSRIFFSEWSAALPKTYLWYDPATPGTFNEPPLLVPRFRSLAVAVDLDGNILSGEWKTGRVIKTAPPGSISPPAGTVLWDTKVIGSTVATADLRGLVVDANNDVWAVHREDNRLVQYDGATGNTKHGPPYTKVGISPYTYSNPPLPNCPCARISTNEITCQGQNGGVGTYSFSYSFTNHSPFPQPATLADLSSSDPNVKFPPTGSSSTAIPLSPPVAPNSQGIVAGTFTVANGKPGDRVCLEMRLFGGDAGWCCPKQQVCFTLPECRNCADAKGQFKCDPKGALYLELTVVNNGPTTAQGFQLFSTTPGVTVSPLNTNIALPPGAPVKVAINVTGASAGQAIDLTVNIHGPTNDKGVYSWCCTSSFRVTYPLKHLCTDVDGPPIDHNDPPVP